MSEKSNKQGGGYIPGADKVFKNSEDGGSSNPAVVYARAESLKDELTPEETIQQMRNGASYIISSITSNPNSERLSALYELRDYVLSNNSPLIPKSYAEKKLKELDQEEVEMIWAMAHELYEAGSKLDKAA